MDQRRRIALARVEARRVTGALRRLPDFVIIGAQRSGTSSLYRYLGQHPSVVPSIRKEVEYFTRHYDRGQVWYRAHFPLRARACTTFEATPQYLYHPLAPERILRDLPGSRFIVLLRDPVARAFSHHQHMVRLGFETEPFERAVELEEDRVRPDLERLHDDPFHHPRSALRFSYVDRGRYAVQLERWFAMFPRDRFLIVFSEDLFADPAAAFDRILRFLDLPLRRPASFENHSAHRGGEASSLSPETRERLASLFRAPDEALARVLGRRPPW
jgi:hypothetical protein